jgi:aryl-alcohol dehydrogenase-like predicted oxidoreductase
MMKRRELGKSGLLVTPIGLGLAALGRPGYINLGHAQDLNRNYAIEDMEAKAHAVLDAAWSAGIRYFDAARSYGRAELFLSSWLKSRSVAPDEVTVGSKWGYTYTAGWQIDAEHHEIKEHSLPVLQRQWRESTALLQPFLGLYQIHSATLESGVLDNMAVLAELAQLQEDGARIGLSLSGPQQADTLRKAMEIRFDGKMLFSAVQATWNVLAQEAGAALKEAGQVGMGIIVKEVLANGRLTDRNNEKDFQPQKTMLEKIAAKWHATIDAVALAAVLQQPWADIVLSGAATVTHLNSNVAALSVKMGDETTDLLANLQEDPEKYWTKRSQLNWN